MFSVIVARTIGRAKIGEKGVSPGQHQCEDRGPRLAERQSAQQPEDRERQDADVDSGDHQDVIRAGALEVGLDVAAEEGAPADQRCLHQRAALARPQLVDVLQHAAPRGAAPHSKRLPTNPGKISTSLACADPVRRIPCEAR